MTPEQLAKIYQPLQPLQPIQPIQPILPTPYQSGGAAGGGGGGSWSSPKPTLGSNTAPAQLTAGLTSGIPAVQHINGGIVYANPMDNPAYVASLKTKTPAVPTPAYTPTPTYTPTSIANLQAVTGYTPAEQAQIDAINAQNQTLANTPVDPNSVYQNTLGQYQAQIDRINQMYQDQINQSRIQNSPDYQARLDQARLQQVQGGIASSPMGSAQTENIRASNATAQANLESGFKLDTEKSLNNIMTQVRADANTAIAEKTAAKKAGTAEYLAYLNAAPERRASSVKKTIKTLLEGSMDIANVPEAQLKQVADSLGVSVDALKSEYNTQMAELTLAEEKRQQEADKAAAELANKEASTAKTLAETGQIGKITAYQSAQLDLEREKMNKSTPTEQATKKDAVNAMSAVVMEASKQDPNGWLTPNQYKDLKQQWVSQTGYEPESFDAYFSDRAYTDLQDRTSPYTSASYGIGGAAIKKKTGTLPEPN